MGLCHKRVLPVSLENNMGGAKLAFAKCRGRGDRADVNKCRTKQISPVNTAIPVATPANAEKSDVSKSKSVKQLFRK